jgi:hypothetical protein
VFHGEPSPEALSANREEDVAPTAGSSAKRDDFDLYAEFGLAAGPSSGEIPNSDIGRGRWMVRAEEALSMDVVADRNGSGREILRYLAQTRAHTFAALSSTIISESQCLYTRCPLMEARDEDLLGMWWRVIAS